MKALGLIPRCNLSRKHDMTEETRPALPYSRLGVERDHATLASKACCSFAPIVDILFLCQAYPAAVKKELSKKKEVLANIRVS